MYYERGFFYNSVGILSNKRDIYIYIQNKQYPIFYFFWFTYKKKNLGVFADF